MNKLTGGSEARRQRIEAYKSEIKQIRTRAPEMFSGYKVSIYTGLGEGFFEKAWNYFKSFKDDYAAAVRELFSEEALKLAKEEAKAEEEKVPTEDRAIDISGKRVVDDIEEKIVQKVMSMGDLSEAKKMELIVKEYEDAEAAKDKRLEAVDVEPSTEDIDVGEEVVDVEKFTDAKLGDNVIERPSNIDDSLLTQEYGKALKYFGAEKEKILNELLEQGQTYNLHAGLVSETIKSEAGLKNFVKEVIGQMAEGCGRDLGKLEALEKKVNEFFDNDKIATALSENDREELIEIIAVAKEELMRRNAIDKMAVDMFKNDDSKTAIKQDLEGIKNKDSSYEYAEAVIGKLTAVCKNDQDLEKLENNVRMLLEQTEMSELSKEQKDALMKIVPDVRQKAIGQAEAQKAKRISEAEDKQEMARKSIVTDAVDNLLLELQEENKAFWTRALRGDNFDSFQKFRKEYEGKKVEVDENRRMGNVGQAEVDYLKAVAAKLKEIADNLISIDDNIEDLMTRLKFSREQKQEVRNILYPIR